MGNLRYWVTLATIVLCSTLSNGFSPHFRSRPVPTDKVPLPLWPPEPSRPSDPDPSNIDHDELRAQLGENYLPEFMSPTDPRELSDTKSYKYPDATRPSSEIRKLSRIILRTVSGRKARKKSRGRQRRLIQQRLLESTACPVRYRWKNLGVRIWPRYIKEGYCDGTKSCSIPAGMHCKPSAETSIKLLHWFCEGILEEEKYCSWIVFQYPIVSECACKC